MCIASTQAGSTSARRSSMRRVVVENAVHVDVAAASPELSQKDRFHGERRLTDALTNSAVPRASAQRPREATLSREVRAVRIAGPRFDRSCRRRKHRADHHWRAASSRVQFPRRYSAARRPRSSSSRSCRRSVARAHGIDARTDMPAGSRSPFRLHRTATCAACLSPRRDGRCRSELTRTADRFRQRPRRGVFRRRRGEAFSARAFRQESSPRADPPNGGRSKTSPGSDSANARGTEVAGRAHRRAHFPRGASAQDLLRPPLRPLQQVAAAIVQEIGDVGAEPAGLSANVPPAALPSKGRSLFGS